MTLDRPAWMDDPDRHCNWERHPKVDMWPGSGDVQGVNAAKAVCEPPDGLPCPCLLECRAYGLANHEYGVWGGRSMRQQAKDRKRANGPRPPYSICKSSLHMLATWDTQTEAEAGHYRGLTIYLCQTCHRWHQAKRPARQGAA